MLQDTINSINGVLVRLNDERWEHITEEKPYMQSYYESILEAKE